MEIKLEQLAGSLKQQLKPVYLISSDEHLLLEEATQQVIDAAASQGHTEKEQLVSERGFNWQSLHDANSSMSLFGEKKIIDLRIMSGKPGTDGSEAIIRYLEDPSPDNLLLIRCPQLNKQSQNAKWVKAIKAAGVFCLIWKVKAPQLPGWIMQRAKSRSLNFDREAAQILAERVEGNLLAAHQEVEKLSLLFPANSNIQAKQVVQTVASNSRYDVFTMMEHALSGNGKKALTMLRGLREERTDLTVVAWAIRNELENLLSLTSLGKEKGMAQAFKELRIWQSKQGLYTNALRRIKGKQLGDYLIKLSELDKSIKGQSPCSADNLCESLLLEISGLEINSRTPA